MQYAGVNFIDTYLRGGIYPPKELPIRLGMEASGVVVKLPTDESLKSNEDYTKRQLNVGDRVVLVSTFFYSHKILKTRYQSKRLPSASSVPSRLTSPSLGPTSTESHPQSHPSQPSLPSSKVSPPSHSSPNPTQSKQAKPSSFTQSPEVSAYSSSNSPNAKARP